MKDADSLVSRYFWLALALLASSMPWLSPIPPLSDFGQHIAQVVLIDSLLFDPHSAYAATFHLDFRTPYLVWYGAVLLLGKVIGFITAGKLVTSISLFAIVHATHRIRRRNQPGQCWLDVLGLLAAWSVGYWLGLTAFMCGMAVLLYALGHLQQLELDDRRFAGWCGFWLIAALLAHGIAATVMAGAIILIWVDRLASRGARPAERYLKPLLWLWAIALFLLYLFGGYTLYAHTGIVVTHHIIFEAVICSLDSMLAPFCALAVHLGKPQWWTSFALLLIGASVVGVLLWRTYQQRAAGPMGWRLAFLIAMLVLAVIGPFNIKDVGYIYNRIVGFMPVYVLLAFRTSPSATDTKARPLLLGAACLLALLVTVDAVRLTKARELEIQPWFEAAKYFPDHARVLVYSPDPVRGAANNDWHQRNDHVIPLLLGKADYVSQMHFSSFTPMIVRFNPGVPVLYQNTTQDRTFRKTPPAAFSWATHMAIYTVDPALRDTMLATAKSVSHCSFEPNFQYGDLTVYRMSLCPQDAQK